MAYTMGGMGLAGYYFGSYSPARSRVPAANDDGVGGHQDRQAERVEPLHKWQPTENDEIIVEDRSGDGPLHHD